MKKDVQGLTMLELIIALALIMIMLSVASTFVSLSLKTSKDIVESTKLESHYTNILFFIERNIEDKSHISQIRGAYINDYKVKNMIDENRRIRLDFIRFKYDDQFKIDSNEINEGFGLYVGSKSGSEKYLTYDKNFENTRGKIHCGNYMNDVYLEPVPQNASFRDSIGVKIIFQNKIGKDVKNFEKTIYFKNRENAN